MPPIETSDLHQTAVLWPADGSYDEYGNPAIGEPVEVSVRWEFCREEVVGPQGSPTALDAMAVVDRVVPIDSRMWLGTLDDWYGESGSAGEDDEVLTVATYNEIPDVRGREFRRTVGLTRYKDSPQ